MKDTINEFAIETTDIKATALEMLAEAKSVLEEDKKLPNMIFAVQPKRVVSMAIGWDDYEEKNYKINMAMQYASNDKKTMAIITMNDCRFKMLPIKDEDKGKSPKEIQKEISEIYKDGEIAEDESNPEAIVMSVSGRGFEPWCICARYHRDKDNNIIWDEQIETSEGLGGRMISEFPKEKVV